MLNITPPPAFKYDVADMRGLEQRLSMWSDRSKLPETELKRVICGQNAVYSLPDALHSLGVTPEHEILLVMDDVRMKRGMRELKPLVLELLAESGFQCTEIILESDGHGRVHPDFDAVMQVMPFLHKKCAAVSVGSGVVTDITKYACYLWQKDNGYPEPLPLLACMTADTVPAYSSRSSIISKDGVKRTWPSRLPDMIVMDYRILRDCPLEYTVAGVGDLFPLFCSFADWYIADALGLADFLDGSWRILDDAKELLIPYSGHIAHGTMEGIEVLSKCLTLCGLSMTYARDSVPVSGYEHVMSHMLDMSAAADGRETGLHGQQVGVSVIWSLAQIEMLMDFLDSNAENICLDTCYPEPECVRKEVFELFREIDSSGAMGEECWNDVSQKLQRWKEVRPGMEAFLRNWSRHKKILSELIPYSVIECAKALAKSTHPLLPSELKVPIDEQRMRWALKNARFMRKRFTSADLIGFLGMYNTEWEDAVVSKVISAIQMVRRDSDLQMQ